MIGDLQEEGRDDASSTQESLELDSAVVTDFREKFALGDFAAAFEILSDAIAAGSISKIERFIEAELAGSRESATSMGQASMLLARARLALARREPGLAAQSARDARRIADEHGERGQDLHVAATLLLVDAHLASDQPDEAKEVAWSLLRLAQGGSSAKAMAKSKARARPELEAKAYAAVGAACLAGSGVRSMEQGAEAAEQSLAISRACHRLADEAAALHVLAQAQMALGNLEGSMDAAEQAVAGWRRLGRGTELVASLGVLVQAHVRQGNPLAGLRASNRELSEQRRNGSPRGVADVLRFIADTHSTLGEPVSALHNAQEALGIYTALGDQLSQASVLLRIAELQPLVGALAEATSSGELALKMFRTIGHRRGEEEAMSILSGLLVTRGLPEQAPRRAEALELARELARAVEARDAGRVEALEDALADLGGLVTGEDIRTALAPVLLGDPAAAGFLQGLGWDMRWATGGHATLACCTPREFYAGAQAAGMSYGPQFRTVHPARLGSHREGSAVALAVLQLPADDRWQARMGFRPGILDGALQCQGMLDR